MKTAPLRVGLTGGIASGKSAALAHFSHLGAPVIDADEVARAVVAPGEPALEQVTRRFGPSILRPDGRLDRRALRAIVFEDATARRDLEEILHPRIRSRMQYWAKSVDYPYCVLCIPLLLETGQADSVDRILVIAAPEALRLRRAMERDSSSPDEIRSIMRAQATSEQRRARAHDVIVNSGTVAALAARVESLHKRYLLLASDTL